VPADPKFATRRDRRRRSYVDEIVEFASARMGVELMPWQVEVLGAAMEVRPGGRFHHHDVVVTTPRQAGKSLLVAVVAAWWMLKWDDQRIMFLAQTRMSAANRLRGVAVVLERAGVDGVRWFRGVGAEKVQADNGSEIVVETPNLHGSHGETYDLVILDESFSYEEFVLQGVLPTQSAVPNSQLWMISTMGTEDSMLWNRYVERGREAVSVPGSLLAFFEWSADLERGDDVYDPSHFVRWHPAIGLTTDAENVRSALEGMSPSEAKRAFGNLLTLTDEELIPDEWWSRSLDAYAVAPVKGAAFSFDVNYDPPGASVAYAFETETGFHVGIAHRESGEGGLWVPAFLDKVLNSRRPSVVGTAGGGAARAVAAPVKEACEGRMVPYRSLGVPDLAASAMLFYEMLREGTLTHGESESLDLAVRRSKSKQQGDQWRFDRKAMSVDSSPLVAVSLALFLCRDAGLKQAGMFVA